MNGILWKPLDPFPCLWARVWNNYRWKITIVCQWCVWQVSCRRVRHRILIMDQFSSMGAVLVPVGPARSVLCFWSSADVTALAPEENARNEKASFVCKPLGCQNPLKKITVTPNVYILSQSSIPGVMGAGGGQRATFPMRGPLLQVEMLMPRVQD